MNKYYFYVIQHRYTKKFYAGSKTGRNSDPSDFMIGYTTSSNIINNILAETPNVVFSIRKLIVFTSPEAAYNYETKFLKKVKARTNDLFYNCHENDCANHLAESHKKWLEFHGVENTFQIPAVQKQIRKTHMKKRGVPYPCMDPKVIETRRQNTIKKYGVENTTQIPEIQRKMKSTTLERYGVENANMSPTIRIKTQKTCQSRFGGNAPASDAKVKAKMKSTTLERYGVENYSQSPEAIEEAKTRNIAKRDRDVVNQILSITSKRERRLLGLRQGWYQKSTSELEALLLTLSPQ